MISSCPAFSVLGIGSVPYDCLFYMDTDGDPQETLEIPGGSVGNVLCALSWLGARSAVASVVGADVEGERTAAHLERFGVRTEWLQRKAGRRTRRLRIEVRRRGDAGGNEGAEEGKRRVKRDARAQGAARPGFPTTGLCIIRPTAEANRQTRDWRPKTGVWREKPKRPRTLKPQVSSLKSQAYSLMSRCGT